MAWWRQKPKTHSQTAKPNSIDFPIQVEAIPGKLSVQVHLQNIEKRDGNISCWTYITRGLLTHQHKEIIFSLRRGIQQKVDEFPQEPFKFFSDVYHFAGQGNLVDVGDISEMHPGSFLNHSGVLYIYPEPAQKNLAKMNDVLSAILLTEEEIAAVKQFGSTRVMARLGKDYSHYPCPSWSDRNRPGLSFKQSMQKSVLTQLSRIWIKGIRVGAKDNFIIARALPRVSEKLQSHSDYLSTNKPIVLFTDFDPSADGCLVWEPGQSGPVMIAPPNTRNKYLCGCFIILLPDQDEDGVRLVEDGWAVTLTHASWQTVRHALLTGQSISIPPTNKSVGFQLEWIQTYYQSPIDGTVYHTESGWELHTPDKVNDAGKQGPVRTKQVVLLTSDNDVSMRTNVDLLLIYAKTIQKTVEDHFLTFPLNSDQGLMTQFELWPNGKAEIRLASRPGIDNNILKPLYTALLALAVPTISHESIKFQIEFTILGSTEGSTVK